MRKMASALTFTVLAAALLPGTAWAECGPFSGMVLNETSQNNFGDTDQSGDLSAGDKRYVSNTLNDPDGNAIGLHLLVANITEVRDDGSLGPRILDNFFVLDDGIIFTASTPTVAPTNTLDNTDVNPVGAGNTRERAILGGTGAYAGATGTLTLTFNDDDVEMAFDMTCP
ncbi:MAG: hypothetical protein AAGG65_18485 [Pseudomonadota bacterium]